ncbi:hypothetical protein EDB82DRAFT_555452 [Fusarium venenatum]|uniref:uncharacterized protein n=1 Tax=Fusarium venenatum TaxID=56646 RepID=UPI001D579705|nr:hypothetical protein EDB82DRAFT_555452 [Fusarium venenatum]
MPRMNLGLPYNHCSLPSGCLAGFQSASLLQCAGCHVINYCGKPHQKADWRRHKVQCIVIKQQREKLAAEEAKLRTEPDEDTNGENPFDSKAGQFWVFKSTPPYMLARFNLMSAILNVRTGEAVQAALDHALDMVRLCRGDNQGVRSHVPALHLRLGNDQEAYDFIKWYAVVPDEDYDWGDASLPFLDLHEQDAFEPVFEKTHYCDVSFTVALTLIKIRLMQDLDSLHAFNILLQRPDIVAQENYLELMTQLRAQIMQLYKQAKKDNPRFWPDVLNPNLFAYDVPTAYTPGSQEETITIFRHSWYSLSETQPAIQYTRGVISNDM